VLAFGPFPPLDKMSRSAGAIQFAKVGKRRAVEELDTKRQSLAKAIADMSAEAVSPEHMKRISGYLDNWDSIDFEDRRLVVDGLISTIKATSESVQIEWKI